MGGSEQPDTLSLRIELGSGMRFERLLEGLALVAAILTSDTRLAWGVLVLLVAQVISPVLAPVALLVNMLQAAPERHRISDIYNDLQCTRGASAVAATMLSCGLFLLHGGSDLGWVFVACPTASCLLSTTVGFCAGGTCFALGRELWYRATQKDPHVDGASDVILESDPPHPP